MIDNFNIYKAELENLCNSKIRSFRSDKGGEYYFPKYCQDMGIVHHTSSPYTPQQNQVMESKNRNLVEIVNSMLSNSN